MLFQLVPLPPAVVQLLSSQRWVDLDTARAMTGADRSAWMQISVAPAQTFERLLIVLPAIAAYVAARGMGYWWHAHKLRLAAAPVIVAGTIEGLIGILQFSPGMRVAGTYVNRNHYAGLLEMAFPLAAAWAFGAWIKGLHRRHREPMDMKTSVTVALLMGCCAVMLFGVAVSQSRMGFIATVASAAAMTQMWIVAQKRVAGPPGRGVWLLVIAVPVCLVLLIATGPLVSRFTLLPIVGTADGRIQITKEAVHLIAAYPLTGCGLGAFEHGLYRYRVSLPDLTVDYAHNDYLQMLGELGVVGGVLLLVLGVYLVRRVMSVALDINSRNFAVGLGLLGSFLALGLHSLVDFNMYIPANALALAWIAGIAASPAFTED